MWLMVGHEGLQYGGGPGGGEAGTAVTACHSPQASHPAKAAPFRARRDDGESRRDACTDRAAASRGQEHRRNRATAGRERADGAAPVRSLPRRGHRRTTRPTPIRAAAISLSGEQRVALIGLACRPPTEAGQPITHWSASELRDAFLRAEEGVPISVRTIGRVLDEAQLQPHRQRYFLTSRDPLYDQKRRDIVGLYLHPPEGATILSLDEKPSIQVLGRKHPDLPMRTSYPVAREFEYVRHGVVHLFAAFNVRSGHVLAHVEDKKTRFEFIDLLERCAWRYRRGDVHCVLDNASYHFAPEVKTWLAERPRFRLHFTPTHASWLNQIECWFSLIARKAVRRSVADDKDTMRALLLDYVSHWNSQAHPFNWAYGEELLERVA